LTRSKGANAREKCVELNDAAGLTRILTANRVMMGDCDIYLCAFDAGVGEMRRGLEIARRIGNLHGEMFALEATGFCMTAAGGYKEAGDPTSCARAGARAQRAPL
jgi:hypothetical protein